MYNPNILIQYEKDDLDRYFKDLSKNKILSKKEENQIAVSAKNGNKQARDKLINSNLKYVIKLAYKYKGYVNNTSISFLDLIQAGNLGLVRALKNFNPDRGFRFITYATNWIECYMRIYVMDQSYLIKITGTPEARSLFFKQSALYEYELNNSHLDQSARKKNNVKKANGQGFSNNNVESFIEKLFLVKDILKLDKKIVVDEFETSLHNTVPSKTYTSQLSLCEEKDLNTKIDNAICDSFKSLTDKEKFVISNRFLNSDKNGNQITMPVIAKKLGVCRERIRQIEVEAIKKMKEIIHSKHRDLVSSY